MAFKLDHWKNPRGTIANVYKDNDMAYVTHGILCAYEVLTYINEKPSFLQDKTILDYGCGTGKNLRALHYFFKYSLGYDPVKECIEEAYKEFNIINKKYPEFPSKIDLLRNIEFTDNLSTIKENHFDYVVANNVVEHLNREDAKIAIENMCRLCKPGGYIIFNSYSQVCADILANYNVVYPDNLESTRGFSYFKIQKPL